MKLRSLFTRKPTQSRIKELAVCESAWATATSRLHLRVVGATELHKSGGLRLAGITAACGTEVAWDRRDVSYAEVMAALPAQHASFHYCRDCLDFLGLQLHVI